VRARARARARDTERERERAHARARERERARQRVGARARERKGEGVGVTNIGMSAHPLDMSLMISFVKLEARMYNLAPPIISNKHSFSPGQDFADSPRANVTADTHAEERKKKKGGKKVFPAVHKF